MKGRSQPRVQNVDCVVAGSRRDSANISNSGHCSERAAALAGIDSVKKGSFGGAEPVDQVNTMLRVSQA